MRRVPQYVFVKLVKYTVLEISAVGALSRSSGLSEVILFPIVCFLVQPSFVMLLPSWVMLVRDLKLRNVRQLAAMLLLDIV